MKVYCDMPSCSHNRAKQRNPMKGKTMCELDWIQLDSVGVCENYFNKWGKKQTRCLRKYHQGIRYYGKIGGN